MKLISIIQAAEKGIERLRLPVWANPADHIKLDIRNGRHGPWVHLYAPFNKECNGRDPVDIICTEFDTSEEAWEPYTGPTSDSDEYKAAVALFDGCLTERKKP